MAVILAAAAERWPEQPLALEQVEFATALVLEPGSEVDLCVALSPSAAHEGLDVEVSSRAQVGGTWTDPCASPSITDGRDASVRHGSRGGPLEGLSIGRGRRAARQVDELSDRMGSSMALDEERAARGRELRSVVWNHSDRPRMTRARSIPF